MSIPVFREGIQIGDDPIYLRPTYIDLNGGELRNVGSINQIDVVGNLVSVVNIGSIGHADLINAIKINVNTIANVNRIDVGILDADVIQNVETISNVGILSCDSITVGQVGSIGVLTANSLSAGSIGAVQLLTATYAEIDTISQVANLYASNASISNITDVDNLTAVNAYLNTIQNVNKAYFIDASIDQLSQVNVAYLISATINSGTFSDVTIATATLDLALFREATIQNVDIRAGDIYNIMLYDSNLETCTISAGKIESVLISNCTLSGLTVDVATISNLQVIGEIQGDNIITASNIKNLAIRFNHLMPGLQNVIGSTLWEAENLSLGSGGSIVDDASASGGKAVKCTTKSSPNYFLTGPGRTLPPGDYYFHFRVKGEKRDSDDPFFALMVYDISNVNRLVEVTLTFRDVYDDFPDWRLLTVLAPNIIKDNNIAIGVKTEADGTLVVDYIKVEPAGAFVNYPLYFKIGTDQIEDFAIISSKIGSFEIYSHHIGTFQIKNSHIDTLQITYDRLVRPPIGENKILNPGFEYGIWPNEGPMAQSTIDHWEGQYCAEIFVGADDCVLGPSNLCDVTKAESIVVSFYLKKNLVSYQHTLYPKLLWYSSPTNLVTTQTLDTIPVSGQSDWIKYCYTLPANYPFCKLRFDTKYSSFALDDRLYIDGVMLVEGDQEVAYSDWTVAKNRWLPDTYFSKEINSIGWTAVTPGETYTLLTYSVTIDYLAKALVFAGVNLKVRRDDPPEGYWFKLPFEIRLKMDGTLLSEKRIQHILSNPGEGPLPFMSVIDEYTIIDEATLSPGTHTFTLEFETDSGAVDYIDVLERYVRVLCGSYFRLD